MSDDLDDIVIKLEQEIETFPEKKNQCLQHLIELGYLPLGRINVLNDPEIEAAKIEFLKEAIDSGLYSNTDLEIVAYEDEDTFLAQLLGKATDIDEGFNFAKLPAKGMLSLLSRITHYRLDIFGLWPFPIQQPFDVVNSRAALQIISEYADCTILNALNYTGDVEKLTLRLLSIHPNEDFILTLKPRHIVDESIRKKLERTAKFKKQLLEDFGERTDFFKYLRKEVLKENPSKVDFNFLNREEKKPFKQFVMRLIQVHQWQDGLYDGLLDSDIGELTLKSILSAIELYNVIKNQQIKTHRVLTHVVRDYYLFNGLFFLQEYMVEDDEGDETQNAEEIIISDLLQQVEKANDGELSTFEQHMNVLKTEISMASKSRPTEKKGILKRIYFGVKKFFRKIVKISRKIFRWVILLADKFSDVLKKVFGQIFNKLSTGIKAFINGIKFLMGRKETITSNEQGLIASVIRIDGDCYNIIAGNSDQVLIEEHNKNIKYNVRSMKFALSLVGGVLKIMMNALSIISWPMLSLTIVKTFKHVSESYKQLNIVTN